MWRYVGRRLLLAIPTLLGASIIVFAMVHLAPGDPIAAVLPVDASKEQIEDIKKAYGFDKPLPVQYLKWLGHVVTGDLGKSIATRRRQPVELHGEDDDQDDARPVVGDRDADHRDRARDLVERAA